MAGRKLITAPVTEPVTLQELKDFMRIDSTADDTLLTSLIKSARIACEQYQNRAYITQTWELALDDWPMVDEIVLPYPPLQSVSYITYTDTASAVTTVSTSSYVVDDYREPGLVRLKRDEDWPDAELLEANAVKVRYVCGYGTASAVPETIKTAIKITAGYRYDHPECGPDEIPHGARVLLSLERMVPV